VGHGDRACLASRSDFAMSPYLPLCLTTDEIVQLTGRTRHSAQRRALQFMAIDHKERPDGSLVVLRSVLDAAAGIRHSIKRTEPNWS
jgi:hypothetical protein